MRLTSAAIYRISVENRAQEGWCNLKEVYPDEMSELIQFLKKHPTNILQTNGKAKKLRGRLKGYYQYDVTYSDRVRYEVVKKTKQVLVTYAGGHP